MLGARVGWVCFIHGLLLGTNSKPVIWGALETKKTASPPVGPKKLICGSVVKIRVRKKFGGFFGGGGMGLVEQTQTSQHVCWV